MRKEAAGSRVWTLWVLLLLAGTLMPSATFAQKAYAPQAPAAAPVEHRGQSNVALGDYYYVGDERIELYRRADQLVLRMRPGFDTQAEIKALTAPAGPLAGFKAARDFGNGLRMFASDGLSSKSMAPKSAYPRLREAISRLPSGAKVAYAAPVFVNAKLGTYAVATDELLVRLQPGVKPEDFFADPRFAGFERAPASDAYLARVASGAGEPVLAVAAALQGDKRIVWAEPNFYQERQRYFTPNDTLFPSQWHLQNTGQGGGVPGADAKLVPAWDVATNAGLGVVIAIVDDGPELAHPDLALFTNANEIASNGIDDDNNGYIDDVSGWDFTSASGGDNDGGASVAADEHGTSVAGVAAGRGNNSIGVTGAAYQATIFPSRIFLGGTATSDANIGAALAYASGRARAPGATNWRGADIVNNSWGGGGPSTAINDALTWAATNGRGGLGTIHFFATGNSSASSISLPASLSGTIASVIAVGASNNLDVRSSYSQYGPQIDFVAPSGGGSFDTNGGTLEITTTDRLGANGYNGLADQDYTNGFGGTSSATPLASGVAALLLSMDPTLTIAQVRTLMRATADKIGPLAYDGNGFNVQYGHGRINAHNLVNAIGQARVGVNLGSTSLVNNAPLPRAAFAGQNQSLTFSVRSMGELNLDLAALQIAGSSAYAISQPFASSSVPLGQSTTFVVSFSSAVAGTFNATISFQTNDPDAPTFTIPIEFEVLPVSLGGKALEDWNGDGIEQAGDAPVAGLRVYLDANGNESYDGPVATTFDSPASLGLGFNDASPVSHTLSASGLGSELEGLEVRVSLTHTWVSDVRLRLVAPNGASVLLVSGAGGSGDNMTNTVFADDAATAIGSGAAPFTGRFRPAEPLGNFNGINPNGDWTLQVFDNVPQDNGTLVNWSLTAFSNGESSRVTNAAGYYAFVALPPGSHTARTAPLAGWTPVSPASGGHSVTITGGETNTGRDFGLARQNSVYGRVYTDANGNGAFNAGTDALRQGETIFLDANGNGSLDLPTTLTRSPALAILDNNATGVTDTLVSAVPGTITGLTVTLNITHTWVSDLEVRLTSPAGTVIPLILRRGGNGDNFTGTVLDDAATSPISGIVQGGAPFTGSFRPEQPLAGLVGQVAAGNWLLTVADRVADDTGTLVSWSLALGAVSEATTVTNAHGNFRLDGVNGTFDLRLVAPSSLVLTQPVAGLYPIALAASQLAQNRDFGVAEKGITISPTSGLSTTEAGGTASFSVVLNLPPTADVSVALSSSNTSEGTVAPASLTFTSADWDTPQTVTVTGVDDLLDDGDVAYSIITAAATSADAGYSGINPSDVGVTNIDNDSFTVPDAPTIGTATAGNASASVAFTAPGNDGGTAITGYTATAYIGGVAQAITGTCMASPCTVNGLSNGTAYTFTVFATNAVGASAESAQSNAVTPMVPATVPGAPTIGTATAGDASASVTFTAPGNDGGSAITGYTATSSPGGLTGSCPSLPCSVSGLDNGTAYTFTVHATNGVGNSAESAASNSVTPAPGPLDPTIRVSVSSANLQGDDESLSGSKVISADGRFVAFESAASNLVAGDTNGFYDVFLRDTSTGITTRISVDSAGGQGNSDSYNPAISPDGRYVAFASEATNLVTGDTNGVVDMFVHDTQTGTTTRISVSSGGAQANGNSYGPALSADGQYVAFYSIANNLVASDTNGQWDIFVRDTLAGTTTRVSVASGGAQAGSASFTPAISADGRFVAFQSVANNLVAGDTNATSDVFLHDTDTSTTTRVSVAAGGTQATGGASFNPSLSADGRYVAFVSDATNLVAGDTNATRDSFVHDTSTGTTRRISVDSAGVQTTSGDSVSPALSGDGRYVIFHSTASSLVAGDTNGVDDTFVHDTVTGATVRVSVGVGGAEADGGSFNPSISADGRYVAFNSDASNLVANDTNGSSDVFRVSLQASVPSAPTIGTATAGDGQADVDFTAPSNDGGSAITGYTATAYIGGVATALTSSGCTSSPCTVTGLSNGTAYTFTVHATNAVGDSPESAESNAVTPQGSQSISFTSTAPSAAVVGGPTYTPTATATSGLAVSFSIDASASAVCSISSGVVSFIGVGTCTINADQAGNAAWLPAQTVQQSFSVGQGSQTISFSLPAPGAANVGGPTYTPTATATSGLAVTLTIDASSSTVCSISAGVVSFIGGGTCTINANQAGNANYLAAPQVQQSFAVSAATVPGAPTIGTATAGNGNASVTFTPPTSDGGSPITGYTARAYVGGSFAGISRTCASSPCTVTGLVNGTTYTFTVLAINGVGNGAESAQSNAVTPVLPLPGLSITDESTKEGNAGIFKALTFRVRLSRVSSSPVTVDVTTVNGSATSPSDFTAGSASLTIPAGAFAATFSVKVIGDNTVEPNETMTAVISNAVGATITDNTGIGTILNDDIGTLATVVAHLPLAPVRDAGDLASHLAEAADWLCGQARAPAVVSLPRLGIEAGEALADTLSLREGCASYDLLRAEGSGTAWLVDAGQATATVRAEAGASWLEAKPLEARAEGLAVLAPEARLEHGQWRALRQSAPAGQAVVVLGALDEGERQALSKLGLGEPAADRAAKAGSASTAVVSRGLLDRSWILRGEGDASAQDDGPLLLVIEP